MNPMPLPYIIYAKLSIPSDADFTAVYEALRSVPGMEPRMDTNGNPQAVYRIDHEGGDIYTLIYPVAVDPEAVKATFTAVTPTPKLAPIDPTTFIQNLINTPGLDAGLKAALINALK